MTIVSGRTGCQAGGVRVDLLVLSGVLGFGVLFIGLATYLGQESRTAYRIDPAPALPDHLRVCAEALGTLEPLLPRVAGPPRDGDGGGPYSDAVQRAWAHLARVSEDPALAVRWLEEAPDRERSPVPHDLLVARARALEPVAPLRPGMLRWVAADPEDGVARFNLGWFHLVAGEPRAAVDPLRAAVALRPADGEAHLLLAIALERSGDLEGARRSLETAEARRPTAVDPVYRAARLALAAQDVSLARELAGRAVQRGRGFVATHLLLGTVCLATREYGQAKREFRDVLQLDPSHPEAKSRVQWLDGVPE